LLNPEEKMWAVKKDGGQFDQFTGATITPRAVVRSVRLALQFFRLHGKEFTADKKYTRQDSTLDSTPSLTLDSKVLTQTEDLADGE
jgi:electron transport complex protein RnfG